ncbi:MAG: RNA methyltransferase [Candidatus Eisenbacteria bacterium]
MQHVLTSRNHDAVKRVRRLSRRTYRDKDRLFVIEGLRLLGEAAGSGAHFREVLYADSRAADAEHLRHLIGKPVQMHRVTEEVMGYISDVVTSQGLVGVVEQVDKGLEDLYSGGPSLMLIADEVRDPGNLGGLIRIADAAGVEGFVATPGCVDIYNPKVVRSAAGSHFHVPLVRDASLEQIKKTTTDVGAMLLGLDIRGERCYLDADLTAPTALVVGNEATGIPGEDMRLLDGTTYIEMPGAAESMNVAAAAAVVLFEAVRQRKTAACKG